MRPRWTEGRSLLPAAERAVTGRSARALGCDYTCDVRSAGLVAEGVDPLADEGRDGKKRQPVLRQRGVLLCLGRIADATVRPGLGIVFQKYEAPRQEVRDVRGAERVSKPVSFGRREFAEVATDCEGATDCESQPLPHPLPASKRAAGDDGRRRC
ncbi:MAG: hypothetical protein M1826_000422 [Phylliscum demangeonii]|nr:MAG: hypothetical protein M1826_000422 [Phylliscum demangeonii]